VITYVLRQDDVADHVQTWLQQCADTAVLDILDGQWRFTHGKLRDGVIQFMSREQYISLNAKIAQAIEEVYEYSMKQNAEALMYHWNQAEEYAREEHYAGVAGEQALRNGAYQAAKRLLERAIDLQQYVDSTKRKIAQLKMQLGDACAELNETQAASRLYRESLELCRESGYRWGVASALNRLGNVAAVEGKYQFAAEFLIDALRTAMEARAQTVALASLVTMAGLLARTGNREIAVQYLSFALTHPACDGQTSYLAERRLSQLRDEMTPTAYDQAFEAGKALDLKEVAQRILSG
jgi:tetratricopeptide (TPR) repeat protein